MAWKLDLKPKERRNPSPFITNFIIFIRPSFISSNILLLYFIIRTLIVILNSLITQFSKCNFLSKYTKRNHAKIFLVSANQSNWSLFRNEHKDPVHQLIPPALIIQLIQLEIRLQVRHLQLINVPISNDRLHSLNHSPVVIVVDVNRALFCCLWRFSAIFAVRPFGLWLVLFCIQVDLFLLDFLLWLSSDFGLFLHLAHVVVMVLCFFSFDFTLNFNWIVFFFFGKILCIWFDSFHEQFHNIRKILKPLPIWLQQIGPFIHMLIPQR